MNRFTDFKVLTEKSPLKERYRIGKKQKNLKITDLHQTYTRSNDDDNRKHPLKYFCLKFHIFIRNKTNLILRLEFIAQ